MVTDRQVRLLMSLREREKKLTVAAAKAGMDRKTARKYLKLGRLPSQLSVERTWRTRPDAFEKVWGEVRELLETNPGLQAKTIFASLQRNNPGRFADGQLRTFQRKVKIWRALEGPPKEVFFPQQHSPGELCQSDFTDLSGLGITIQGQPFRHLLYHLVLTYSNWETGTVCFSESYEALSEGLQNGLWKLGGVPKMHQSDRLSAAVHKLEHPDEFTRRYRGLLDHYGLQGKKIQAGRAHENGDIEQRHRRFKDALDQALMLRGSRDFSDRGDYDAFLEKLFDQLNAGRRNRLEEELQVLRRLPAYRLNDRKRDRVRVGPSSTIRIQHNTYSVESRLIGEVVDVHRYAEYLEIWYAQRRVDRIPRLRGQGKHSIQYRHVIDWLVRKPGAFENYRYRDDLFPTSRFRMAYDAMKKDSPTRASREYVRILYLAARESEEGVDRVLGHVLDRGEEISEDRVKELLQSEVSQPPHREVEIIEVDLAAYDDLLAREVAQ